MTEQENNDRTKLLLKDESRSRYVLWAAPGTGIRARRTPTPSST